MNIDNVIIWIYNHRKGLLLLFVVLVVLGLSLRFFMDNALVIVTANSPPSSAPVVTYASHPEATTKVGTTGLMLIPRSTTNMIFSNGEYMKSEVPITIPWYGILEVAATFKKDRGAEKVAFAGLYGKSTCATYSVRLESLLSYKCTNPPTLLQYQTPDNSAWTSVPVAKNILYPNKVVRPYMGGILGISVYDLGDDSPPQPIIYTADTGLTVAYDIPEGIDESSLSLADVFTNQTDPTDDRFVFVTGDGTVYLGKPTGVKSGVNYKRIDGPKEYTKTPHRTLCRVMGENAYCYSRAAPVGDNTGKLPKDDTIRIYDFDGNTVASTELHESLMLDSLYITRDGDIYGKSYKQLMRFNKNGDAYTRQTISQNIDDAVATSTLYFTQKGGVYEIDPNGVARQVFYSEKVAISYLYATDEKLFMLGMLNRSSDKHLHAYALKNEETGIHGERLIDLLPMEAGQLPGVIAQELVGNKLRLQIAVPYVKTEKSGSIGDSDTVFNEKKQAALNALTTSGIDISALDIHFTY